MTDSRADVQEVHAAGYPPGGGGGYGPPGGGGYGPPGPGGPPGYGPPPGGVPGAPGSYSPPGYGPPPGGGYGPPGGGFGAGGPNVNPLAIVSMILGICAIPTCCCWFIGAPLAVAGLVLGIVSLQKIRSEPQTWKGGGMAIAGIVCASIAILLDVFALFSTFDEQLRHRITGGA